jgi:hypothetical protein
VDESEQPPGRGELDEKPGKPVRYDTNTIRQLLNAAFDDEELTTLCFDYFRDVYEAFSTGMSKHDKIQRLIEHCERQRRFDELLTHVKERNPHQYRRFESRLHRVE